MGWYWLNVSEWEREVRTGGRVGVGKRRKRKRGASGVGGNGWIWSRARLHGHLVRCRW